jgi:hypothetical protein
MKLNKQLKTEGIIIMICLILLCIGVMLRVMGPSGIFIGFFTGPFVVLVIIALLIYWIYQVVRYQKQH